MAHSCTWAVVAAPNDRDPTWTCSLASQHGADEKHRRTAACRDAGYRKVFWIPDIVQIKKVEAEQLAVKQRHAMRTLTD